MTVVPARRLVLGAGAAALASAAVLVWPAAWLPLLAFNLLLAAAAALDWRLTPRPSALEARREAPPRLMIQAEGTVALTLRNGSGAALRARLRDSVPDGLHAPDADADLSGVVPARGEASWRYAVRPRSRGRHGWGPIHLAYRSVLGLWEFRKVVPAPAETRVYPDTSALGRFELLARADRLDVLGIRRVPLRGGAWEFESLRDYVPGDDVRRIDWKASARRGKPIFKNHRAERNQTVLLLVDSGRLMNAEVAGVPKLDHALGAALVLAHVALGRGDRVGLCTFSHRVHTWLAPRAHLGQIRPMTEALYDLRGDSTETDHGRALRLVASRHSKRALLVVLTDFVDSETASDLVAHLHLASRHHLVLFAALRDPFLDRAARLHPDRPIDGYRKAAAVELLHERRAVLERIRLMGAHVLDASPAELTPPLLNRYLQIALRGQL